MEIEKASVCSQIAEVCKANGWNFEENVKTEKWKADIVVEYANYKVAFNIGKSPRNIEETHKAMRGDRVCGCWLLLPAKNNPFINGNLPCFHLTGTSYVCLGQSYTGDATKLTLSDFTTSIVEGRIRWADKMQVRYVDVCFVEEECWKCGTENHIYFISRMYSEEGIEKSAFDFQMEEDDITFNPLVVKAIQEYIANHLELGLKLGEIKERFSKTRNESYMSFGCFRCNSIFGDHYRNEAIMENMYNQDDLKKIKVDLGESGFTVPAMCWYKKV